MRVFSLVLRELRHNRANAVLIVVGVASAVAGGAVLVDSGAIAAPSGPRSTSHSTSPSTAVLLKRWLTAAAVSGVLIAITRAVRSG